MVSVIYKKAVRPTMYHGDYDEQKETYRRGLSGSGPCE